MAHGQGQSRIDWTDCPLMEVVPGKVSGAPILKGTRIPADGVVENYESGSPVEEIAENFELKEGSLRDPLAYAAKQTQCSSREGVL